MQALQSLKEKKYISRSQWEFDLGSSGVMNPAMKKMINKINMLETY